MKNIFSYSEKGTAKYNEDIMGTFHNAAWVIDGATPLFKKNYLSDENDVVWIVNELNKWLPQYINDESSLESILLKTVNKVNQIAHSINKNLHKVKSYELPTFTIMFVRIINNQLEYYVLGDSGMLVKQNDEIRYITDKRIESFSKQNENSIKKIQSTNPKEKDTMILSALQETRKRLNTEDGYWVGSLDAKGIPHGIKGIIEIDRNTRIVCFSDGYARLFELYHILEIRNFSFELDDIKETIRQIRELEKKDKDCSRYPRAKQSDDLSVVLIENSSV